MSCADSVPCTDTVSCSDTAPYTDAVPCADVVSCTDTVPCVASFGVCLFVGSLFLLAVLLTASVLFGLHASLVQMISYSGRLLHYQTANIVRRTDQSKLARHEGEVV